jgi:hypothetical protein
MSELHRIFLESVAEHISELMLTLGKDWPHLRDRLLALAGDRLDPSQIVDAILDAALRGSAAFLIRRLMREASAKADPGHRRTRRSPSGTHRSLARENQLVTAAAARLIEKLKLQSTLESEEHENPILVGPAAEPIIVHRTPPHESNR